MKRYKSLRFLLLLIAILIVFWIAYRITIWSYRKTISFDLEASESLSEREIQAAVDSLIAEFTFWHSLSAYQFATIQSISYEEEWTISYEEEWSQTELQYRPEYQSEQLLVLECTYVTDDNASEKVVGFEDHFTNSEFFIFTRKANFLPWKLQDHGQG